MHSSCLPKHTELRYIAVAHVRYRCIEPALFFHSKELRFLFNARRMSRNNMSVDDKSGRSDRPGCRRKPVKALSADRVALRNVGTNAPVSGGFPVAFSTVYAIKISSSLPSFARKCQGRCCDTYGQLLR